MISVDFNSDTWDAFLSNFGTSGLSAMTRDLAEGARSHWVDLAREGLNSTRNDYIRAITAVRGKGTEYFIELRGEFVNLIEQGMDPYDLHDTLLREGLPGVKKAKDGGLYRSIPFRHKTPGASSIGGSPMGSQFGERGPMSRSAPHTIVQDSKKLGRRIHRLAKKLGPKQSLPAGLVDKLREHHATDIFAGMVKRTQETRGRSQATYATFRTISKGPDGEGRPPGKWLHPGIQARDFAAETEVWISDNAGAAIDAFVSGMFEDDKTKPFVLGGLT